MLETRMLGYISRRDTLQIAELRRSRIEITLLDTYALGDIDAVAVCVPTDRATR